MLSQLCLGWDSPARVHHTACDSHAHFARLKGRGGFTNLQHDLFSTGYLLVTFLTTKAVKGSQLEDSVMPILG